ncbi:MAG: hypothetical protein NW201_06685 [Gemmatimonadales bacterium]|nr:hypothetical protein [Gemmatimonadales bacterium]
MLPPDSTEALLAQAAQPAPRIIGAGYLGRIADVLPATHLAVPTLTTWTDGGCGVLVGCGPREVALWMQVYELRSGAVVYSVEVTETGEWSGRRALLRGLSRSLFQRWPSCGVPAEAPLACGGTSMGCQP